jgi:hypothetical protein
MVLAMTARRNWRRWSVSDNAATVAVDVVMAESSSSGCRKCYWLTASRRASDR